MDICVVCHDDGALLSTLFIVPRCDDRREKLDVVAVDIRLPNPSKGDRAFLRNVGFWET